MTAKLAEYSCKKRITDPQIIKEAQERMDNPNIITGKEGIYYLFEMMGMHIEWDEIFAD